MQCETVKVVSPVSDDNPHGYIIINKSDLTQDHELFDESAKKVEKSPKPLSVDELRAALTEKGIDIPEGSKKADLQALLATASEE
jgi:hypothetical protein